MAITFEGFKVTLLGKAIEVGDKLLPFRLTDLTLKDFNLGDVKFPCVILTIPSVDTSVCSLELLTFNDKLESVKGINCYGISMDLPFAQDRWVKSNAGDYITMLSDYKYREFSKVSGTLIEELMLLTRAAFIFDKEGKATYIEYVSEVTNEPNYERILSEAMKVI